MNRTTVILCTYNRCQSLAKALDSLAVQILPDSIEWEVLVVDNNSTDQTHEVCASYSQHHPGRFRYLFEPRQGKSHALNAGIRDARGDVLAFTDDDVTVEPTWLRDLTTALHAGQCVGAGGRTLPDRMFSPPRWLPLQDRYALGPLAVFDPCLAAGEINEPPFGNNMAFRKQAFEKYGFFRTDLGPCPGSEIRSEDTEFGRRLLDGESDSVMNPPPSFITRFLKAEYRRSTSWRGGSTRPELTSRNLELRLRPSCTSREFRCICSEDWPSGPCDG